MFASLIAESLRGALALNTNNTHISPSENSPVKAPRTAEAEAPKGDEPAAAHLSARSRETLATALERLRRKGPWKMEARVVDVDADPDPDRGAEAVVESCRLPGCSGKIFRLTATLSGCTPEHVWTMLRSDCTRASWLLAQATPLQALDEGPAGSSDVQLQVSAPRLGGLVASREFLLVRRWCALPGGAFALVTASTEHQAAPTPSWHAPRAVCGPGGWLLEPAPGGAGTRMRWVVDCALGGWLPASVSDAAYSAYMLAYVADLHTRCRQSASAV